MSLVVQLEDGSLVKRHFDQIRKKLTRISENTSSNSEEAEEASAFVSYPPESSTPPSKTNTGDITTETAKIQVSHPSTVPNSTSVLLEEIYPEVTNLQRSLDT